MGRHKGSQSDREVFLQLTLGRSTREGCWTRTVGNERSEFTIEPEGRPRATNEGEAEMKWLTALDDFRNWLDLGLQPAKAMKIGRASEWRRERRDRR